jgi:hypothetical protein
MRKTILVGMTAVALMMGGCARKTPPPEAALPEAPAPVDPN